MGTYLGSSQSPAAQVYVDSNGVAVLLYSVTSQRFSIPSLRIQLVNFRALYSLPYLPTYLTYLTYLGRQQGPNCPDSRARLHCGRSMLAPLAL